MENSSDSKSEFAESQMGYFLDFSIWQDAFELLEFQIQQKRKGHRHYNTLSMYYYEKLWAQALILNDKGYFSRTIGTNLYYGLEKEFFSLAYVIPKKGFGLRNYKLLSCPMRVLYGAVALYLVKVSFQFLVDSRKDNIKAFYGGKLVIDDQDKLQINASNIYFLGHYKSFRNQVRKEINQDTERKAVIKLDIENFYDSISVGRLLELLNRNVKQSVQKLLRFDNPSIQEQILSFFELLSRKQGGIPQTDNDIVSGFLGSLFLTFGDLQIDDEVNKEADLLDSHTIIRYVDDIYVSLTFKEDVNNYERESTALSLTCRIADTLYNELGLKLNQKTKIFWLNDNEDREDLTRTLKRVSPQYHVQIADDKSDETPQNKIENLLEELDNLKRSRIDVTFQTEDGLQDEIFKDAFDPRVQQLLNRSDIRDRVALVFEGFNFELVKKAPAEILSVLLKDADATRDLTNYLLRKGHLTTGDINLILRFLSQTGFTQESLIEKLADSPMIRSVIQAFSNPRINIQSPGYYELSGDKASKIAEMPQAIAQIKMRILNEISGSHSVALNHLVNEIHSVCHYLESPEKDLKDYSSNDVCAFLQSRNIRNSIVTSVRNLFDRRHVNQISHPGSEDAPAWGVSKQEYETYRRDVGKCLSFLL